MEVQLGLVPWNVTMVNSLIRWDSMASWKPSCLLRHHFWKDVLDADEYLSLGAGWSHGGASYDLTSFEPAQEG